jgi:hypothetical protein
MKALFFTLLLLFIAISPSIATPSRYLGRQRIFYNVFTPEGVFTIELLYSPATLRIVQTYAFHTEIGHSNLGVSRIVIHQRNVRRWTFNTNPPVSEAVTISAEITFVRPMDLRRRQNLPLGVSVINPQTVTLAQLTQNPDPGVLDARPLEVTFVLLAVLEPDSLGLDPRTDQRIRELGMRRYLELEPHVGPAPIPPLELDAGIWIHLLTDMMLQYHVGEIQCQPAPAPPLPNPDEACRQPVSRPRDPGDQDDPSGQPGSKRICVGLDGNPLPDLNDEAGGQGGAGQAAGGGSSRQHVDDDYDAILRILYNPQHPEATYEVRKQIPYEPLQRKVIYNRPDPHVEIQTNPFLFLLPDWLINLVSEDVHFPPQKPQRMKCHEAFIHDELRK